MTFHVKAGRLSAVRPALASHLFALPPTPFCRFAALPLKGNAIKLRISQIFSDRKLLRVCGFIMQQNHNNSSYIFNKFQ
jgi:hypothetical protein